MANSGKRKGNPQVEDGYTRIANELLEQIALLPFNGSQYAIILCIMRNTYGYRRKAWKMSANYIAKGAGLNFRTAQRELKYLEKMKIISVKHCGSGAISIIGINKKYDEWELQPTVNRPLRSDDRTPYGQSTVGSYGQSTVGAYGQMTVQQRIDKQRKDNKEKSKKGDSLHSLEELHIPEDWQELLPEYTIDYRYGKLRRPDGVLFNPLDIDWKGLRE